jgi:predicted transcriptional regulator of viral defense system
MSAAAYIEDIAARGHYHFTTGEFASETSSSESAARAALRRLRDKRLIATPYRGFHVIVPPEYRRIGCLPAEQFVPQLMQLLGLDYYVALLSAARYLGAAHQQPQVFQVMVQKNRPAIDCGDVRVEFMARRNVASMPSAPFNTPRGGVLVATAEATAFDLVGYVSRSGGIHNVATILSELAERLDADSLVEVARLSPTPWAQRLGYLLSVVRASHLTEPLADHVARTARETVPLDPGFDSSAAPRDPHWKLSINVAIEPDL